MTRRVPGLLVHTGAELVSATATKKSIDTVARLSLTRTRTWLVDGPWASVGVQTNRPLVLTRSPSGPDSRVNLKACAGRSGSFTGSDTDRVCPSVVRRRVSPTHAGAALISWTWMRTRLVTEAIPSPTTISMSLVEGPWASVGVHCTRPSEPTVNPVGPERRR